MFWRDLDEYESIYVIISLNLEADGVGSLRIYGFISFIKYTLENISTKILLKVLGSIEHLCGIKNLNSMLQVIIAHLIREIRLKIISDS